MACHVLYECRGIMSKSSIRFVVIPEGISNVFLKKKTMGAGSMENCGEELPLPLTPNPRHIEP